MWLPVFILVVSATGCLCDPYACFQRENNCDMNAVPRGVPGTVDELNTICQKIQEHGTCIMEVTKKCEYSEDILEEQQEDMDFIKEVCKEENPIFKVISRNLECIKSAFGEMHDVCESKIKNSEPIGKLFNELMEDESMASTKCLFTLIEVTCPAIVAGHRCDDDEVRNAINALLGRIRRLEAKCPEETREKLDPLYDTYKSLVLAELNPKNEMEDRK